uniref:RIMS-binding protein 2 n=1 Tax=Anabas testudineus TaxID=64144 RepID=A0A3Q1HJA1_ANATE
MSSPTTHPHSLLSFDHWPYFRNECLTFPRMLSCECGIMRKDRDNPLALSSKTPFQSQTDYGRELERLRADLEAEKNRTQWARRHLLVEIRRLREEAEREQRRAVRELTARSGCQKDKHSNKHWRVLAKELSIKDTGRCSKVKSTGKESFCLCSIGTHRKLNQLLLTLYEKIHGEQAIQKLHHRQEFELEKAIFLCHLLDAYGRLLQRRPKAEHPSYIFKHLSKKPTQEEKTAFCQMLQRSQSASHSTKNNNKEDQQKQPSDRDLCAVDPCTSAAAVDTCWTSSLKICHPHNIPHAGWDDQPPCCTEGSGSDVSMPAKCMDRNMENGTDSGFLVRQNSELLRALDELEKTCSTLREENVLLRKSSAPETEEKVRRLRRKNTELAVLAKRLEDRARKLQEANLKVNSPSLMRPGSVEQYKRAFARQRARDLAQHADTMLSKDKEIAALQEECRALEARLVTTKGSPVPSGRVEIEKLLRESQREVLRLQRQLSVTSSRQQHDHSPDRNGPEKCAETEEEEVVEKVNSLITIFALFSLFVQESELSKKRKECENLEHEVKKRQKRCLDLESQLEDERGKNEQLKEEADLLRRKTRAENEELREGLSEVTAQHNSVLEENQRLRAKLENLEQVLKHMREVAERRQQLELEHEQALAILKFKQDEIKRLQRAQLFAKREHEGVVQMLESKVRDLEEKCRSQSEQFGLLSQELEKFRLQASKVDLSSSSLLNNPTLRMGATPHAAGLSRVERSPVTKHRELPTISVSKSASSSSKSETTHLTPKSDTHLSPEVEELDIDVAPAPYTSSRGAAKLQVFIARYSYNPYDGPNDNPEVELPLTAGEYIYVYGDMDDDGFYEGELMDGRRGLVPSNFVERVSDDDVMSSHHPETGDVSHNSLLDSSLHSASHQHHLHMGSSERTEAPATSSPASAPSDSALAVPAPLTNGLDLDLEEVGVDIVPYPRKLTLIKQLAKSIIIGWDPPLVPAGWGNVWSYNVYVDQELRLNVPFGAQTKAVLERLDINLKAYRVSVQSLTEKGHSDQLRCSMLVGRDVCVAPTQLRVDRISATSANLTWLPSNSNYVHIVSLNDEECELVKAGCYSLCLNNLLPSLQYTVKVEARPHRTPWELPVERREHRSATITFTTLMAGPPDAPLDVQLEHGPSPGIALISWLPVTIDAAGTSNGVRVTGYTIYADRKKVLEVSSPTAGSALLGPSQIQSLQAAQELTVRTMSAHGESCDSLPVNVPCKLAAIMSGPAVATPVVPVPVPSTPVADNSRSDLSDILEEEEEELYSDHIGEAQARGYTVRANRLEPPDSDEEVLERILKLPPQAYHSKQLFSIPEVTEEEDSSHEDPLTHHTRPNPTHFHPKDSVRLHHSPPHHTHHPNPNARPQFPPHHHHFNRDPRSLTKEPLPRHRPLQVKPKTQHRCPQYCTCVNNMKAVCVRSVGISPVSISAGGVDSPTKKGDGDIRIFVALFPYDPTTMSPNPDAAEEELPFTEGQIIKVYGDKDADGFYRGESGGRLGYVPCNMVSEIQVEDEETRQQLLQQGFLSTAASMEKIGTRTHAQLPRRPVPPPKPRRSKKGVSHCRLRLPASPFSSPLWFASLSMVAIFDYDPRESSPNTDIEAELTFSAGDVIQVFGDMDEDGFFYGELNGHRGLVPSNFLQALPEDSQPAPEPRRESQVAAFLSILSAQLYIDQATTS